MNAPLSSLDRSKKSPRAVEVGAIRSPPPSPRRRRASRRSSRRSIARRRRLPSCARPRPFSRAGRGPGGGEGRAGARETVGRGYDRWMGGGNPRSERAMRLKRNRRCRKTEARDAPSRRTRSRSWRSSSFSPRYSRAFDRGGVRGSLSCLARQLRAARTDEAGMLIHPSAKSASIRPTASQQAGSKVPFFTQRSVSTFDRPPPFN